MLRWITLERSGFVRMYSRVLATTPSQTCGLSTLAAHGCVRDPSFYNPGSEMVASLCVLAGSAVEQLH
jgi:hypothetical protein